MWLRNSNVEHIMVCSLDRTHNLLNDDQFILSTESCNCPSVQHSLVGGWKRAEHVAHDMIADVNSWSTGWCVTFLSLNSIFDFFFFFYRHFYQGTS